MTTILLKNKNTSAVPTAGDLTNSANGAELALNVADKRMYSKDGSGNVVEMGTNPSSITTGAVTATSVTDSGLTSGRVPYASTGGLLADSVNLTFNGTTLTANTLNLANALGTTYGGTGLTSFTSGGAVYASSTSALTTGTLPATSGGTGLSSFTSGGAVYATSTSALTTGTLPVASGGTGNSSYTDGQLLIGNSGTGGLSKATLTAGSGVTITNGNGTIQIAASSSGITTGKSIAMAMIFGF